MFNHHGAEKCGDLQNYAKSDCLTFWNQLRNNRSYRDVPASDHTMVEPQPWTQEDITALRVVLHKRVVFPTEIKGKPKAFKLHCVSPKPLLTFGKTP